MALSRTKTWIAGEVLTASDLNTEFNNILTNALSLISPLTGNLAAGGNKITGLGAAASAGDALRYEQLFTTGAVQLLGAMDWVKGADIASPAGGTLNLTTATGNGVHITGTNAITAVTLGTGMWRLVVFDGILTLTHHATNNKLPGGANITTAAGDTALYWADGTTVYCVLYQRAGATPLPILGTGVATRLGGPATALGNTVLIETITASSAATVDFDAGLTSTYSTLILEMVDVYPGTDAQGLRMRVSTDGGSNYLSTNEYSYAVNGTSNAGAGGTTTTGTAATFAGLTGSTMGSATGEYLCGTIKFHGLAGATRYKGYHASLNYYSSDAVAFLATGAGTFITTSAVNAIRLYAASGNINGTFSLYGVRTA